MKPKEEARTVGFPRQNINGWGPLVQPGMNCDAMMVSIRSCATAAGKSKQFAEMNTTSK